MKRLGLTSRLILTLCVGFFILQAVMTAVFMMQRRDVATSAGWMPYPDQLASIVTLFENAGPDQRALLLRAFSDGALRVGLADEAPATDGEAGALNMPAVSNLLQSFSDILGTREVRIAVRAGYVETLFPRMRAFVDPSRVRISIALSDGNWLVLQRQEGGTLTLGGLPIGLLSGVSGVILALLVIGAIWRETRPLRRLQAAAAKFGADLEPKPIPPAGAVDLRELIVAFNAMQERIARMDKGRTDMMIAIGHDIRTPLTRLQLRLRHLDADLQAATERDIAEITSVADEAVRFAAVGMTGLEQRVDLAALLKALAARKDVSFENVAPASATTITGSADLLTRCFDNLIGNALRYGQRCRITLSQQGSALQIILDDDGPGIPETDRDRLLQPFERGEGSRNSATGGFGLGLALANRIVQRHGGQLSLQDAPSGGLRVRVAFDLPPA